MTVSVGLLGLGLYVLWKSYDHASNFGTTNPNEVERPIEPDGAVMQTHRGGLPSNEWNAEDELQDMQDSKDRHIFPDNDLRGEILETMSEAGIGFFNTLTAAAVSN